MTGELEYYFRVNEDGTAIVRCVQIADGREISYSEHSSSDLGIADADGSLCPPDWSDAQAWSKATLEQANALLLFDLAAD